MGWTIEFDEEADRNLAKLGKSEAQRILTFLFESVAKLDNPRDLGKALTGPRLGSYWSYRVGDYRIVCDLLNDRLVVLVLKIGHRRDVYR